MNLEPCVRCRRHVDRASVCPFCARRGVRVASAVLAAAALGVTGCGGDPPRADAPTDVTTSSPKEKPLPADPVPTGTGPVTTPAPTETTPTEQPGEPRVHPLYGVSQP